MLKWDAVRLHVAHVALVCLCAAGGCHSGGTMRDGGNMGDAGTDRDSGIVGDDGGTAAAPYVARLTVSADPSVASVRENVTQWNWDRSLAVDDGGALHAVWTQL